MPSSSRASSVLPLRPVPKMATSSGIATLLISCGPLRSVRAEKSTHATSHLPYVVCRVK